MSTQDEYSAMQGAYKAIREKLKLEGASISLYALLLWAYNNKECQAYFKGSPWLLRVQIAQCIQNYCAENEEEVIKFAKGVPYEKPALDF
jgi:hypothetical protein